MDGELSNTFLVTLSVPEDDSTYNAECVATSLNPNYELALHRTAAATLTLTSEIDLT